MALPTGYSCVSSVALTILTFAGMQLFKDELATEGKMTILGGFVGSWFFIFLLTAVGNAGTLMFSKSYHTRLFPEVTFCIASSMFVSALVHRVCATTCLLFSLLALFFINRISQSTYVTSQPTVGPPTSKPPQPSLPPKSPRSSSGKSKSKHG